MLFGIVCAHEVYFYLYCAKHSSSLRSAFFFTWDRLLFHFGYNSNFRRASRWRKNELFFKYWIGSTSTQWTSEPNAGRMNLFQIKFAVLFFAECVKSKSFLLFLFLLFAINLRPIILFTPVSSRLLVIQFWHSQHSWCSIDLAVYVCRAQALKRNQNHDVNSIMVIWAWTVWFYKPSQAAEAS